MPRVIRFHRFGGPEVLCVDEMNVRLPGPGEVRLHAKALGLNRAEALMRAGKYIETPLLPSGLGLEVAGTIEAIGQGVNGFHIGDAVSIIPSTSMVQYPTYGELVVVRSTQAVRHPEFLNWTEAAAVWMSYLTAYGALVDVAKLKRGDVVVITAASSSVGLAAIQIANKIGAIPIAVSRTSAKREKLLEVGAHDVVSTDEQDLEADLRKACGDRGARLVFDAVGGPIFHALCAALGNGGILIEYGGLCHEPTPFPLFQVLVKSLTLRGYLVHEVIRDPGSLEVAKAFILDGLRLGSLRPIISKAFAFDEIAEAHRYLESNVQFGKIVVTL